MHEILLLYTRLKSLSCCEDVPKDRNIRDHLARTIGNGDTPRMGTAWVKQAEEERVV